MAFKYQALNDSRSSLNSLSSLGSSRSIDSPGSAGSGGGGGRQRPRLEFSAAGTCGSANIIASGHGNRNSVAIMSEVADRSSSLYWQEPPPSRRVSHKVEVNDGGEGVGAVKSDSNWRQSLQMGESGKRSTSATRSSLTTDTDTQCSTSGHTTPDPTASSIGVLKRKNRGDFNDGTDAANTTTYSSSAESETGLYIHSSVRSGGSGLKFSRQLLSTPSARAVASQGAGERQPLNHQHHNINQNREHGKLFKVLQKFSNKRAQQRVEIESEKRARKSPHHMYSSSGSRGNGTVTERGRDKENMGHQKRSHKNKQGKKGGSGSGRFPVSKSSDLLSGYSDVVYHDINTEVIDPQAIELEVDQDTLIYTNSSSDRPLGRRELLLSHDRAHRNSSEARHSMPPGYEIEEEVGASRHKRVSVRRTSSLNGGVYYGCGTTMDTGALTSKSAVISLNRNGSKRKSHDLLLFQGGES